MQRVWAPTLALISVLLLGLAGCGDNGPSQTEQANQAADQADQTAAADSGAREDDQAPAVAEQEPDKSPPPQRQADARDQRPQAQAPAPPPRMDRPRSGPPPMATRTVGAGVQGDVGLFYDPLSRMGSWVRHAVYGYVWIPARMGPGWRPYQEGQWLWTNQYGWYWDSDEPFGWATYHYGRWDYDPGFGWFWVPGDVWAPAWVTWRFGPNAVGWAPIAPDRPGYAYGAPTRYVPPIQESWVFVDRRNFADDQIGAHVIPMSRLGAAIDGAGDIRTPRYDRGQVFNMVIKPDEVQRFGGRAVQTRDFVYVRDRNDMFDDVQGRRFGIYRPMIVAGDERPAPPAVVDVARVDRIVVQEFASPSVSVTITVPSAALLDVLDPGERQGLVQARLGSDQAVLEKRIAKLRAERAALIEQKRKQAVQFQAQLEKQRQQAMQQRLQAQQQIRAQRRQLAAEAKLDTDAPAKEQPAAVEDTGVAAPAAPAPKEAAIPAEQTKPAPAPKPAAQAEDKPGKKKKKQRDQTDLGSKTPADAAKPAREPAPEEKVTSPQETGKSDAEAAPPPPAEAAVKPAPEAAPAPEGTANDAEGSGAPKKKRKPAAETPAAAGDAATPPAKSEDAAVSDEQAPPNGEPKARKAKAKAKPADTDEAAQAAPPPAADQAPASSAAPEVTPQ